MTLRTRLLVWLLGGLTIVGLGAGFGLYRNALGEANAVYDEHLRDTALAMRSQGFFQPSPRLSEADVEADIVVQVWSLDGVRVHLSQPHAVLPGLTTLGYSTVETLPGEHWRVYGLMTPFNVIQVAQPLAVREARAARLAGRMLVALALVLPILAGLIWFAVGRSLKPVDRLAREVQARRSDQLSRLPTEGLPGEIQPLVSALNTLLKRAEDAREHERAFIADAAHELRTPLTALRLQLDRLANAPEAERHGAIESLADGISRAARLIEQLLAMARSQSSPDSARNEVNLADVASSVVAELLPLADARHVEIGVTSSTPVTLRADADALHTLVRNLVDNAIRHSPEGGHVDTAVTAEPGTAVLEVTDEGKGIRPADRARAFERFHRLRGAPTGGSGLGLAIVRTIVEAHAGTVELLDGPGGRGLRVRVRIPLHEQEKTLAGLQASAASAADPAPSAQPS
jgi:two-component system OmpR family sensor kinase